MFSNQWLITIDLDGTLLTSKDEKIDDKNIKIIRKVQERGHKVAIVTGRPWRDSKEIYNKIGLDTIISNYNGALISNPKDSGFLNTQTSINRKLINEILNNEKFHSAIENIIIEYEKWTEMLHKDDTEIRNLFHIANDKTLKQYKYGYELKENPFSVTIKIDTENFDKMTLLYNLKRKYGNSLLFRYWEWPEKNICSLEINQAATTKGSAMRYIASYYNIPQHRTMAFGDGLNDIEMLSDAAIGIAMLNASDIVKNYANDITDYSNDEIGVGRYLEDFFGLPKT